MLLLILAATPGLACTDYSDYLRWQAFLPASTEAVRALAHGDWVLIALERSLLVAEASPAGELTVIGEYGSPFTISDVCAVGNTAYLAVPGLGLQVIDIETPSDPELVATLATPGTPQRLCAGGGHLYLGAGAAGIAVYSLGDPTAPAPVDTLDTPGHARGLQASANLLLLADDLWGLRIYSIAEPAAPVLLGTLDTPGAPTDVVRQGELALLADRQLGLQIVDIADPAHPILVAQGVPGDAWGVAVQPGLAFLSDRDLGLLVYEIDDPSFPQVVARLDGLDECRGVLAHEGIAFVCHATGVAAAGIDATTTAPPLGSVAGSAFDLFAFEGRLYAVDHSGSNPAQLCIWDAAAAGELALLGSAALGASDWGYATDLVVQDGWAYAARAALYIVDVGDPAAPHLERTVYTGGAHSVAVEGSRVLVGSPLSPHVWVGELSSPSTPEPRSSIPVDGTLQSVAIRDQVGYFLCGSPPRILSYDISDLGHPVLRSSLTLPSAPQELVLEDALGFVSLGERGIAVLDFAVPEQPALLGEFSVPGSASKLALQGTTLAMVQSDTGGWLADVANPSSPRVIGFLQSWLAAAVAISPSGIYLADRAALGAAIRCFDLPCPDFTALPNDIASVGLRLDAHPNPARLGTTLSFSLGQSSACDVTIYDCRGRALRHLFSRNLPQGEYRLQWDGCDDHGRRLASGHYIARLTARGGASVAKLLLIH